MRAAVKVIGGPVGDPARHGNHDRRIITHGIQKAAAADVRHTCKENQFGDITSIQWKLDNALVVHDRSQTAAVRFDKGGVRLNFNLIGNLTYLEYNIDGRTGSNLQDNSTLHIAFEARQSSFHHVRSEWKTCKDVIA